jgi:O-antigen ligase
MDFQLTGSLIADLELLLGLGLLLCLFFFLVLRRPIIGLVCFLFLVLTRAHEYIPHAEKFRPSVVVGIVMLAGLFIHLLIYGRAIYFTGAHSLILLTFVAFCWISLFAKGHTLYDYNDRIMIEPLLLAVVAFFGLLNAIRSAKDYRMILLTLSWAAVIICVLTLVQSFITGLLSGKSYAYYGASGTFTRAATVGLNPNDVAFNLTTLLPLIFFLFFQEKRSGILKALRLASILLIVVTVLLTFSRAGLVSLFVALFLIFRKRLGAKYRFGLIALIIGLAFVLPGAFWERLLSTGTIDPTGQGRLIIYQTAVNMIQAHPLTGVGYGQFYYLYSNYGGLIWRYITSHQTYLGIAAETGLISLFIYLCLFGVTFVDLRRIKHQALAAADTWTVQLAEVFTATLILTLVAGITSDRSHDAIVFIMLALAVVLNRTLLRTRMTNEAFDVKMQPKIAHSMS